MAATITKVRNGEDVWGKTRVQFVDFTGDTSYPTGGYTISPAAVGMKAIIGADIVGANAAGGNIQASWNNSTGKLMLSYPSGGGATSPAALSDPAIASGATAVTSAAANGSSDLVPGRGKELAAATNVSTLTFRLQFFGY